MTLFASSGNSRTFNYQPGDVSYIPASFGRCRSPDSHLQPLADRPHAGHYVENIGNTTLKFLEIFNADRYQDISLNQWLALTPPALVKAHLQLPDSVIDNLNKTKSIVIGPSNSTQA